MSSEAITRNDLQGILNSVLPIFYPVGCYFETSDGTFNPNVEWGGEWILETEGQVHVSAGSSYNVAGAISNTSDGGSTHLQQHTHDFTRPTVPEHDHGMAHTHSHSHQTSGWIKNQAADGSSRGIPCAITNASKTGTYTSDIDATASNKSKTEKKDAVTTTGGGVGNINNVTKGLAANSNLGNMPPFINVYRWHRVA